MQRRLFTGCDRRDLIALGGAIIFFLLLTALVYPRFATIGTDGVSYALLAKNVAAGEGFQVFGVIHTYFSPLFSLTIVPLQWIFNNIDLAAHATVFLLGFGTLVLLYFTTRRITDPWTAGLASFFLSVNSSWVAVHLKPLAQPLAGFLSVVLFALLLHFTRIEKFERKVFFHAALLGILGGLLFLTRPEYIFIVAPLTLFVFFVLRKETALKRNMLAILILVVAFFVTIAPYILFLHSVLGEWTITGRLHEQYQVTMKELDGTATFTNYPALPGNPIVLYVKSLLSFTFYETFIENLLAIESNILKSFGLIGTALFGIGLFTLFRERKLHVLGALSVGASMLFALALGHTGERGYLTPFLFLFAVPIAVGLRAFSVLLVDQLALRGVWKKVPIAVMTILCFATFSFVLFQNYFFRPPSTQKPLEYQELGVWIKENVPHHETAVVAARKPEIAYYADTSWFAVTGIETPESLVASMHANNVEYVAIDTRSLGAMVSKFITDDGIFRAPELELMKEISYYEEHIYLYRLKR